MTHHFGEVKEGTQEGTHTTHAVKKRKKKKGNGQRVGHRFRQARVGLGLDPIAAAWP